MWKQSLEYEHPSDNMYNHLRMYGKSKSIQMIFNFENYLASIDEHHFVFRNKFLDKKSNLMQKRITYLLLNNFLLR